MSSEIERPTWGSHLSSDEWWSIDNGSGDVALQQRGWSVTTFGGSRYDLPTKRGDNRTYPYRPGARHNKNKMAEERVVKIQMWLQSVHPGTGQPDGDMKLRFNDSWNFLRELVWSWSGKQLTLSRRWWQTIQGVPVLHRAQALVEISDSMPPTMQGRYHATFEMTLRMASPFFYGDWITETIQSGETKSIWNPGQDRSMFENLEINFRGPLYKPVLTNDTTNPDVWLKYDSTITGGVVVNVPDFLAFDSAGNNVIRYISWGGARFFWGLVPGANMVRLEEIYAGRPSGMASNGYVQIKYRPAFI